MVAANIATARRGGDRDKSEPANLPVRSEITQKEAAEKLQVSERTVRDAVRVRADGVPELAAAVEQGDVSVSAAAEVAKLPPVEQKKAVRGGPPGGEAEGREGEAGAAHGRAGGLVEPDDGPT